MRKEIGFINLKEVDIEQYLFNVNRLRKEKPGLVMSPGFSV